MCEEVMFEQLIYFVCLLIVVQWVTWGGNKPCMVALQCLISVELLAGVITID